MGVPTCRGTITDLEYAGGILSGKLTVSPGSGGCADGGQVWVTGGDLAGAVSGTVEEGTGLFEIQVALTDTVTTTSGSSSTAMRRRAGAET